MSYYKSPEEFLELMTGSVSSEYSTVKGTWLWEILKSTSISFSEVTASIDDLLRRFYADDLEGDELDAYTENWSYIRRKKAAAANGHVTFYAKANQGGVIPEGVYVSNGAASYITLEEGTVTAGGSVSLEVKCCDLGEGGNAAAGSVNKLVTSLSFIERVSNENDITGGEDRESDESLRDRFYRAIKKGANAGNRAYYEELAESIEGVGRAFCEPVAAGEGTAYLYIVNSDGEEASSELIETVQAVVDPNKNGDGAGAAPIGAQIYVKNPGVLNVYVYCKLKLESGYTVESVFDEVYEKIESYLNECSLNGKVLLHRVGKAILKASGVYDYTALTLNGYEDDVEEEDGNRVIYRLKEVAIEI